MINIGKRNSSTVKFVSHDLRPGLRNIRFRDQNPEKLPVIPCPVFPIDPAKQFCSNITMCDTIEQCLNGKNRFLRRVRHQNHTFDPNSQSKINSKFDHFLCSS